eukprot:COSAG02_NODE_5587_length_4209_cov_1.663504_2_plen_66_part_00
MFRRGKVHTNHDATTTEDERSNERSHFAAACLGVEKWYNFPIETAQKLETQTHRRLIFLRGAGEA